MPGLTQYGYLWPAFVNGNYRDLEGQLHEMWQDEPQEIIQRLCVSMPDRDAACLLQFEGETTEPGVLPAANKGNQLNLNRFKRISKKKQLGYATFINSKNISSREVEIEDNDSDEYQDIILQILISPRAFENTQSRKTYAALLTLFGIPFSSSIRFLNKGNPIPANLSLSRVIQTTDKAHKGISAGVKVFGIPFGVEAFSAKEILRTAQHPETSNAIPALSKEFPKLLSRTLEPGLKTSRNLLQQLIEKDLGAAKSSHYSTDMSNSTVNNNTSNDQHPETTSGVDDFANILSNDDSVPSSTISSSTLTDMPPLSKQHHNRSLTRRGRSPQFPWKKGHVENKKRQKDISGSVGISNIALTGALSITKKETKSFQKFDNGGGGPVMAASGMFQPIVPAYPLPGQFGYPLSYTNPYPGPVHISPVPIISKLFEPMIDDSTGKLVTLSPTTKFFRKVCALSVTSENCAFSCSSAPASPAAKTQCYRRPHFPLLTILPPDLPLKVALVMMSRSSPDPCALPCRSNTDVDTSHSADSLGGGGYPFRSPMGQPVCVSNLAKGGEMANEVRATEGRRMKDPVADEGTRYLLDECIAYTAATSESGWPERCGGRGEARYLTSRQLLRVKIWEKHYDALKNCTNCIHDLVRWRSGSSLDSRSERPWLDSQTGHHNFGFLKSLQASIGMGPPNKGPGRFLTQQLFSVLPKRQLVTVFHNLQNYDAHFLIKPLAECHVTQPNRTGVIENPGDLSVLGITPDKYKSITKHIPNGTDSKGKEQHFKLSLID
ncbi:hypothetical protein PR048_009440 [Dryococelus australis]|uniref:Uncharacterized protein n=1 Tax=Dryococelus australis TaxID=614101 RepID=A0ABQ9HZY6_9NEOP|nr:hypothetical protein PR048_009440 [Dryococelus australis]